MKQNPSIWSRVECEGCGKDPENRAPEIRLFPYDDYGDEDAPYESSDDQEEAIGKDSACSIVKSLIFDDL